MWSSYVTLCTEPHGHPLRVLGVRPASRSEQSDWEEEHQFYHLSTAPVGQGKGCAPAQGPPRPRPYTLEVYLKVPLIHKS